MGICRGVRWKDGADQLAEPMNAVTVMEAANPQGTRSQAASQSGAAVLKRAGTSSGAAGVAIAVNADVHADSR